MTTIGRRVTGRAWASIGKHVVRVAASLLLFTVEIPLAAQAQGASIDTDTGYETAKLVLTGHDRLICVVMAKPGRYEDLVARLHQLNSVVLQSDSQIGMVITSIPVGSLPAVLSDTSVDALTLDGNQGGGFGDGDRYRFSLASPTRRKRHATRLVGQFRASSEYKDTLGMRSFAHRAGSDGRGVKVLQIEDFPDFLAPELSLALDRNGRPIRKFVDVVNLPPVDQSRPREQIDWRWVKLSDVLHSDSDELEFDHVHYRLPRAGGNWRIGSLSIPYSMFAARVTPKAALRENNKLSLTVLWDNDEENLRLSRDNDGDFSLSKGVRPFRIDGDIGVLPIPEVGNGHGRVGFAVQTDLEHDYLSVNFGLSAHATMTTSALAAHPIGRDQVAGVAPGAQIILYRADPSSAASYASALVAGLADRRADVALIESSAQVSTSMQTPGTAASALEELVDRAVRRAKVPTVVTADNMTSLSTVDPMALPGDVLAVGGLIGRLAALHRLHADIGVKETIFSSSSGPGNDGAVKPDVLAPMGLITIRTNWSEADYRESAGLPSRYRAFCTATSCSAPVAAGVLADIIGAAHAQGWRPAAPSLLDAVRYTARFIPTQKAYTQGYGVIQTERAFEYLSYHRETDEEKVSFTGDVRTRSANVRGETRGKGVIYENGRPSGGSLIRVVGISWPPGWGKRPNISINCVGDTRKIQVDHRVRPSRLGVGQAVVRIIRSRPSSESIVCRATRRGSIVGGFQVTDLKPLGMRADGIAWRQDKLRLRPLANARLFVEVGDNSRALLVTWRASDLHTSVMIRTPGGLPASFWTTAKSESREQSLGFDRPEAGVWEIDVQNGEALFEPRTKEGIARAASKVRFSFVTVPDNADDRMQLDHASRYAFSSSNLTWHSAEAAATELSIPGVLPHRERLIELSVPNKARRISVMVRGQSNQSRLLEMHLFSCRDKVCHGLGSARGLSKEKSISLSDLGPSDLMIVLDGTQLQESSGCVQLKLLAEGVDRIELADALKSARIGDLDDLTKLSDFGAPATVFEEGIAWTRDVAAIHEPNEVRAAAGVRDLASKIYDREPIVFEVSHPDRGSVCAH